MAVPANPNKGLRLEEVALRPVAPLTAPATHAQSTALIRTGPMAQAGSQASSLAAVARSVTAAARREVAEQSHRPTAPEGSQKGFRLSDLNPLPIRRR
jgi:hypothetical protein